MVLHGYLGQNTTGQNPPEDKTPPWTKPLNQNAPDKTPCTKITLDNPSIPPPKKKNSPSKAPYQNPCQIKNEQKPTYQNPPAQTSPPPRQNPLPNSPLPPPNSPPPAKTPSCQSQSQTPDPQNPLSKIFYLYHIHLTTYPR